MHFSACILRPIINGKLEEKTAGDGPGLDTMFEDDKHLQGVIGSIRVSFIQICMYLKSIYGKRQDAWALSYSLELQLIKCVPNL